MDDLDRQIADLERQLLALKQRRATRQTATQASPSLLLTPNPQTFFMRISKIFHSNSLPLTLTP